MGHDPCMIKTPIAIVGMGKSGESARRLLLSRGVNPSQILTFDQKAAADFKDPQELMKSRPQTLVVSPGVPLKSPWLEQARKDGLTLLSEIDLACTNLKTEKLIGVTGSLGKSTTVSLLGDAAKVADPNAFVGGNLGTPLSDYAYEMEQGLRPRAHWIVLELSSYQLENSEQLHLDLAAITFLSPNHLERYASLEDYYQTKWNILKKTKGSLFLNAAGGDLLNYAQKQKDFSRCKVCSKDDANLQAFQFPQSALLGSHNQDNIALAAQMALACGWPQEALQALKKFKGLEHRIENVGIFEGIQFINDSKATALDSVLTAASVAQAYLQRQGRVHLLLGGKDKSLPWEELAKLAKEPRTQFLFFGQCRELAKDKSGLPGKSFPHLEEALNEVFATARKDDIVLLSPGGTSLDEFKGFEDRGRFFKEKVRRRFSKG